MYNENPDHNKIQNNVSCLYKREVIFCDHQNLIQQTLSLESTSNNFNIHSVEDKMITTLKRGVFRFPFSVITPIGNKQMN